MTTDVKITDVGHVRTILLNRPEKKNALSDQLAWGVVEAVEAAARDDNVWVIALTGSGDSFCAGLIFGLNRPPYSAPETALRFAVNGRAKV